MPLFSVVSAKSEVTFCFKWIRMQSSLLFYLIFWPWYYKFTRPFISDFSSFWDSSTPLLQILYQSWGWMKAHVILNSLEKDILTFARFFVLSLVLWHSGTWYIWLAVWICMAVWIQPFIFNSTLMVFMTLKLIVFTKYKRFSYFVLCFFPTC